MIPHILIIAHPYSQLLVLCAALACSSTGVLCSRFIGLWMADCPDFYSICPLQVDTVGESMRESHYTSPSLEMAEEIEEYMNKTFPKLNNLLTSTATSRFLARTTQSTKQMATLPRQTTSLLETTSCFLVHLLQSARVTKTRATSWTTLQR